MNTRAPHPTIDFWYRTGRKHGQAGQITPLDPDDYGRFFADDNPPDQWVQAANLGIAQGAMDWLEGPEDPELTSDAQAAVFCDAVAKFPFHVVLAAWVAGRLKRFAR